MGRLGPGLWVRAAFAWVFFFAAGNLLIRAQLTTAAVSGNARDASGAVVPGATVTVKNTDTGMLRTLITDDEGRYLATQLPLGHYEVAIELVGFQREVRSGIQLSVGREAIVDFALKVGEVTETVTISSEAALVETTTSSLSGLVDDRQIRALPLNGRSLESLAALEPGVTLARGQAGQNQFNIGGARANQSKYLLDGSDIVSVGGVTPGSVAGVLLGVEAIREFKVLVNNFSAEFSGGSGGVVSAVTRSGTNEFHGSAFEFVRNSALDARNFFDARGAPPPFKRHQFGFSLGGPIRKDQTFFFVNYEGLRDRLTNTAISNVPTAQARQGILPRSQVTVNSASASYLKLVPLPNGRDLGDGTGEFIGEQKIPADDNYFMLRIDQNFSAKDSLYARYSFDDATKNQTFVPLVLGRLDESRRQYFTLEETRIFSPRVLNSLRLGYNRSAAGGACYHLIDIPSSLNLVPGKRFGTGGGFNMTTFGFIGLTACAIPAQLDRYNVYELAESVTWNTGRHSFKTGALVKNIRDNNTNSATESGEYTFNTLESFLTGRPTLFRVPFPDADASRSWRQTLYGFYVQDDFKLKVNLTLNLGLRYEFVTGPLEAHGRSARLLKRLDAATTVLGLRAFVETSKTDFAPRVGFAWDPSGKGKMSFRGGFGLFFEPVMPYMYAGAAAAGVRQPPFFRRANLPNPPFPNAYAVIANSPADTALNNLSPTATPYAMQFNLNLQRELAQGLVLSLGYLGSRGVHLLRGADQNSAVPVVQADGRKFFPAGSPRRNPFIGEHINSTTDAHSWHHGMVVSARKRLSGGNQFQLSYTLAKTTDNSSQKSGPDNLNSSRNTMDPDDLNRDHSVSAISVAQNLVLNYTYGLPLGRGRRFAKNLPTFAGKLVSGWQVNGITTIASGIPINMELGFNAARDATVRAIGFHQRPDLAPGRSNNPVLGGPDKYMDAGSFRVPAPGYYGNLGRNTVIGPSFVNFDFGLFKGTSIHEGKELEFRAEIFNLANHANFNIPAHVIFNDFSGVPVGSFGRITSTINTSRQIQFGLKFSF
ncbi:MAG: TonB-dependent receptor [Acidobacteria bacterium]|nr:TonB-dependent receptor [Acidobacteriota bacterium]